MTNGKSNGWRELFAGRSGLRVIVFASGVGLQAIEVFIGATVLPSVVADIGGLDLFAWNTTLFIVASILANVFAAIRPFSIGPRTSYLLAAAAFGAGSIVCGTAPDIWVLLLGRTIQGFGAGLLGALTYGMIRIAFPQALWPRAMALISSVWGVATLVGPAIGGILAGLHVWRWAFMGAAPLALLLAAGAFIVLPARAESPGMSAFPVPQIFLVVGAVLAVSLASVTTGEPSHAALLLVAGLACIVILGATERRVSVKLLPTGTFRLTSPLALFYLTLLLLQLSICSDVFAPLFLQRLHALDPLEAGYTVAALSAGWSIGSVSTAGWTRDRARFAITLGPVLLLLGALALFVFLARPNPTSQLLQIGLVVLGLFAMGVGIGISWQQLVTRVLAAAPTGESDRTSAALSMVQSFAAGLGAAMGGVIVNGAGITAMRVPVGPAQWLYGIFALVPLLAIPLAMAIARRDARHESADRSAAAEPLAAE